MCMLWCACTLTCVQSTVHHLLYSTSVVAKFTDEQYTTISQSTAGRFDPRVFANCLQVKKCCERRPFIWLQSGDVINTCVNKVNTVIGSGTKTEVTLVEGVIG